MSIADSYGHRCVGLTKGSCSLLSNIGIGPNVSISKEQIWGAFCAPRTVLVFEQPNERISGPAFVESFSLTVGQLFSWIEE
ncbi:hypothetical protein [Leptolyngbya sp. 7M]|uniref:hypothetical protein n=1 Tax=Leptolyngbya sp. 7M TaxID=2812896 RepID=UPI001B8BE24E|nr:hypothetical protein [Leptolyngbya sp. 7M]QYO68228.1 hypothetical protein JVX88_16550 [Leptolyngbya sp. 7M]